MKSACKKLILVCFMIAVLPIFAGAKEVDFCKLDFFCNGKFITCFEDKPIFNHSFWVQSDVILRKINAPLNEKRKFLTEQLALGKSAKDSVLTCFPLLKSSVDNVIKSTSIPAVNSKIFFSSQSFASFRITKEKAGKSPDENELYEQICYCIMLGKSRIDINLKDVSPTVYANDNKLLTYKKATFLTSIKTSSTNRKHNVSLALQKINGSVIEPNSTLSFNKTVGERTEKNGFLTAKIILDAQYVDGVGGGVCQASTTLYNCALLAGLKADSVRGHSLLPSYIEPSFDAMVSSHSSDLVLRNPFSTPIFIRAYSTNENAVVEIYGKKEDVTYKRISKTIFVGQTPKDNIIYEHPTPLNQYDYRQSQGCPQIKSEGYLLTYKDGVEIERRKIRSDTYKEKQGVFVKIIENT